MQQNDRIYNNRLMYINEFSNPLFTKRVGYWNMERSVYITLNMLSKLTWEK